MILLSCLVRRKCFNNNASIRTLNKNIENNIYEKTRRIMVKVLLSFFLLPVVILGANGINAKPLEQELNVEKAIVCDGASINGGPDVFILTYNGGVQELLSKFSNEDNTKLQLEARFFKKYLTNEERDNDKTPSFKIAKKVKRTKITHSLTLNFNNGEGEFNEEVDRPFMSSLGDTNYTVTLSNCN